MFVKLLESSLCASKTKDMFLTIKFLVAKDASQKYFKHSSKTKHLLCRFGYFAELTDTPMISEKCSF